MNIFTKLFGARKTGFRLQHVIEQVYLRPLLITPEGFASVDKVIQSKLANDVTSTFKAATDIDDLLFEPMPVMEVVDKVAFVPIIGPIGYKVSSIEKVCGICDVGDVKRSVQLALEDELVEAIVLDVSSPGGSVTHVPEVSEYIANAAQIKPVLAFTDDLCASAAYYLIAGATEIYATPSSEVGSIGCYMALLTYDKLYREAGIDVNLFVGDKARYKALGFPGMPLTEDHKALLQSEVDAITRDFKSFVKKYRPQVLDDAMEGQCIMGKDKLTMGLVDSLVSGIDEIIVQ
jgi:signal peptide peptidase SppA